MKNKANVEFLKRKFYKNSLIRLYKRKDISQSWFKIENKGINDRLEQIKNYTDPQTTLDEIFDIEQFRRF